ncbi:Death domain-containing protein CRADD, partial [Trichoplax sp. H2]
GRRRETFMYIADRIKSTKLKEFGRKLKLQPNDVDDIADTSDGRIDKCIHLLETWYTTFASEATFDFLGLGTCNWYRSDDSESKNLSSARKRQTVDQLDKLPKMSSGLMTQEHREILRASRMLLARKCRDQISPICEYLLGASILTSFHKQTIESKSTAFEKVCTLLDILPERGDRAFDEFCDALTYCEITVENFNSGRKPKNAEDIKKDTESETSQQEGIATQNDMDPIQDDLKRPDIFIDIADNAKSIKVIEFGRKLRLSHNDVDDLANSNRTRFDKFMNLLEEWYSQFASTATFDKLLDALRSCNEVVVAEKLKKKYSISSKSGGRKPKNSENVKKYTGNHNYRHILMLLWVHHNFKNISYPSMVVKI